MKRVLYVQLSSSMGGIESFLMNLTPGLNKLDDYEISVLSDGAGKDLKSFFEKSDISVLDIPQKKIRRIKFYFKIVFSNKFDIIHFNKNSNANILLMLMVKLFSKSKVIVHSHNTKPSFNNKLFVFLNYLNRPVVRKFADKKLAVSRVASDWLFGSQKSNMTIVRNGIDIDTFKYSDHDRVRLRSELGINKNQHVLLHVGRFTNQKNHQFLIRIFKKIVEQDNSCVLILVGDGPDKAESEKLVSKLNLSDSVIFIPKTRHVNYYLSAADIFVFPSLYEGLPISLVEAEASGIDIVASNTIASETFFNSNVYQLDLSSEIKWTQKINELFSTINFDSSDYSEYRIRQLRLVQKNGFDNKDLVKKMVDIYSDLV